MKKLLLKWFMPSPEDMAKIVATAAAKFINGSDKSEAIKAFIEKTKTFSDAQVRITRWLADGKFDEAEVQELEAELKPMAELLYAKVLENVK